jgi:hypothetical protein
VYVFESRGKKSPANKPIRRMSQLAVMQPAQWHGEFVTDFAAKRAGSRKLAMVRIRRAAPQARQAEYIGVSDYFRILQKAGTCASPDPTVNMGLWFYGNMEAGHEDDD